VLGKLGGGAMGMVYRAKQLKLDREVAIKVIAEDIAENPQFLQRFEREAQTLAKLNHPNIVTVYDFGQDLDICYFVTEHVEGQDLAQLLRQRRLNMD
jgi:serine/threonine protein kinase